MSIPKIMLLVASATCGEEEELRHLKLNGGEGECVTDLKYLGSVLAAVGGIRKEIWEWRVKALQVLAS